MLEGRARLTATFLHEADPDDLLDWEAARPAAGPGDRRQQVAA